MAEKTDAEIIAEYEAAKAKKNAALKKWRQEHKAQYNEYIKQWRAKRTAAYNEAKARMAGK